MKTMDLIDRSKLPRIRLTGFREERLLTEVIGVLNDVIQNAPTVDAVPREEHESLLKRFRHLLESDFIRSFDEYDPKTGTYKRDISEADAVNAVEVVRCKDCRFSGPVRQEDGSTFIGPLHCHTGRGYQMNVFGREYSVINPYNFCASGKRKMDAEVKIDENT